MDKMLYIAMSGAKQNMHKLAVTANNLANAKTTGFKADLANARAMQAFGEGLPTRVFSMTERQGQNFDGGALMETGNDLDIAIEGDGWFAVQDAQGNEAYTRAGKLKLNVDGSLETAGGNLVMGDTGPVVLPLPISNVEISRDGVIMVRPEGAPANALEEADQIRLVKPDYSDIEKGNDGLFRRKDGQPAQVDATVMVVNGMVESSNVNPVHEMTQMISIQRQFEMQLKLMKTAEETDSSQSQLLRAF